MTKRALLISLCYEGTESPLAGCRGDAINVLNYLRDKAGFDEENIQWLADWDDNVLDPTGANIAAAFEQLVGSAEEGDNVVIAYSGHGSFVPAWGFQHDLDAVDQCICSKDGNWFYDDDFCYYLNRLPAGVSLTFISDSCFSGGLLEKAKVQVGPSNQEVMDTYKREQRSKAAYDAGVSNDLEAGDEMKTGASKLQKYLEFGSESVPSIKRFAKVVASNPSAFQVLVSGRGDMDELLQAAAEVKAKLEEEGEELEEGEEVDEGDGDSAFQVLAEAFKREAPQWKPEITENMVLISGCNPLQTSADLGEGGALTMAILQVLEETSGNVSFLDLVNRVRDILQESGKTQEPCLYGSDQASTATFIFWEGGEEGEAEVAEEAVEEEGAEDEGKGDEEEDEGDEE